MALPSLANAGWRRGLRATLEGGRVGGVTNSRRAARVEARGWVEGRGGEAGGISYGNG